MNLFPVTIARRDSSVDNQRGATRLRNIPYKFAYMYLIHLSSNGNETVTLPNDRQIVLLEMSAVSGNRPEIAPVSEITTPIDYRDELHKYAVPDGFMPCRVSLMPMSL